MTLTESVAKLSTLLPALKAGDAKFASDLIVSFKKYGGLTPKQEPWIERLIARAETPKPVFSPAIGAAPVAVNVGGFASVVSLFVTAKAHLKFPKVRLILNGTKLVLSLNGEKSKKAGHVSITGEGKFPNRAFYGSVSPEGVFTPFKSELTGLSALLTELSSNPARVAKEHGKLTGNCCFCNKVLGLGKEQRSVLVGFGPDCAEHYGLKAEWLAAAEKAEAKASVSLPTVAEKLEAVAAAVPTLTVSAGAQKALEDLAEGLAKASGSVTVTATDGPLVVVYDSESKAFEAVVNTDELQSELGPEYGGENPGDLGDYVKYDLNEKAEELAATMTVAELNEALQQPANADTKAALIELAKEAHLAEALGETAKVCFFCEQPAPQYASLQGYIVCPTCVAALNKGV